MLQKVPNRTFKTMSAHPDKKAIPVASRFLPTISLLVDLLLEGVDVDVEDVLLVVVGAAAGAEEDDNKRAVVLHVVR
jgi:hypothetical protein